MTVGAVEFTAPCPAGHPGATWRSALVDVPGSAGWDYLGVQLPRYGVECRLCGRATGASLPGTAAEI